MQRCCHSTGSHLLPGCPAAYPLSLAIWYLQGNLARYLYCDHYRLVSNFAYVLVLLTLSRDTSNNTVIKIHAFHEHKLSEKFMGSYFCEFHFVLKLVFVPQCIVGQNLHAALVLAKLTEISSQTTLLLDHLIQLPSALDHFVLTRSC